MDNTLKTKTALMTKLAATEVPSKLLFLNEKGDIEVKLESEVCIVQGLVPWVPGYTPANCNDISETLWEQLGVYNCHHNYLTGHALRLVCSNLSTFYAMYCVLI